MIGAGDLREARLAREAFLDALVYDDPVQLYEKAPCGFVSTTSDGLIVKCNATFRTWLGLSAQEIVGVLRFADLLAPGSQIFHDTHYLPALLMHGSVREIALDVVAQGGRRLPVLVNATLERDERGAPALVRTAIFEATERRAYERELLLAKQRAEESEARATELARTLQQTLVPPTPPDIPGLQVSAAYHPAGNGLSVGGDFYDVFPLAADDWIVLLGDICGKGVEAAVVAGLVRHSVRALADKDVEPAQLLTSLNDVLLRHGSDRFCTAVLARIRLHEDAVEVVVGNAGHPAPYLVSQSGLPQRLLVAGQLLGVFEGGDFLEARVRIEPGETLVLYTDGVTEARNPQGYFGGRGLREVLSRTTRDAPAMVDALLREVLGFQGGDASDDIAIVAIGVPSLPTAPGDPRSSHQGPSD